MQEKKAEPTRRIKQISVRNLFGMFDHTIPLNLDERITIIHGPNGFGKTMILKMLNALFSANNRVLQTTPFDEFRIEFDDSPTLVINKKNMRHHSANDATLTISNEIEFHSPPHKTFHLRPKLPESILSYIEHGLPFLERIESGIWRNMHTEELLTTSDVFERFEDSMPHIRLEYMIEKEPNWLKEIRSSVRIRFVETQRLLKPVKPKARRIAEADGRSENAVTECSNHLAGVIKTKLAEYAALSQTLERSFPVRVVNRATRRDLTEEELRSKLDELEEKRARLTKAGLLDKDNDDPFQVYREIDASTKFVLSVYVEDVEKKLSFFDDLANRIDLLTKVINRRFLYKKLTIDRENGFIFTTRNGEVLSHNALSSGEQHEVVLLYELLFIVERGSLILIDEPELSLHVVWQEQFLKDVQEITKLTDFDILMATHSPDIIHDRRDLVVELKEPKLDGKLQ